MIENEFNNWLDNFIKEKKLDLKENFKVEVDGIEHLFDLEDIVNEIKNTSKEEQKVIRNKIVEIDFYNADVKAFFRYLAELLSKTDNSKILGIENYSLKEQVNRINAKNDIRKLDLLYRKILDIDLSNKKAIDLKENITNQINEKIVDLMAEYHIPNTEYLELILENKDYKRLEERKEQMAEDRYTMIWENCSTKEIVEILRDNYSFTDKEIIDEFVDEDTQEEAEKYLIELNEIEQSTKNIILDNGYIFAFEDEFYFSKLKEICENSQKINTIPDATELAIITNSDVSKEAFLVKYDNNIEIVYNFYNKFSKEMESYETEIFDISEINSKEELIEVMKEKLEHFEEKYNRLEQDESNIEVE